MKLRVIVAAFFVVLLTATAASAKPIYGQWICLPDIDTGHCRMCKVEKPAQINCTG